MGGGSSKQVTFTQAVAEITTNVLQENQSSCTSTGGNFLDFSASGNCNIIVSGDIEQTYNLQFTCLINVTQNSTIMNSIAAKVLQVAQKTEHGIVAELSTLIAGGNTQQAIANVRNILTTDLKQINQSSASTSFKNFLEVSCTDNSSITLDNVFLQQSLNATVMDVLTSQQLSQIVNVVSDNVNQSDVNNEADFDFAEIALIVIGILFVLALIFIILHMAKRKR